MITITLTRLIGKGKWIKQKQKKAKKQNKKKTPVANENNFFFKLLIYDGWDGLDWILFFRFVYVILVYFLVV